MRGGALFGKRDGVIRKNPLVGKRDRVIRKNPLREKELRKSGGAFLKGKEGRVGFRTLLLFHHVPEEQSITYDISAPHTLRLLDQAIEPFQAMILPPDRCTLHGTGEEVKDSTDGTYMTMDVQLIPMRVRPLFLLRRRHANPEQIRVGSIDGINDSLVVLIRELGLIRRRIRHHLQMRIHLSSTLHDQVKHLL